MMPNVDIKIYFYLLVGASLGLGGLNLANLTFDPSTLKLDKRLLSKIKTLMPGKIFHLIKQKICIPEQKILKRFASLLLVRRIAHLLFLQSLGSGCCTAVVEHTSAGQNS